ncbi:MAG: pilus assembly protein TadG-related protein [Steroidobacteraceae bacterium]
MIRRAEQGLAAGRRCRQQAGQALAFLLMVMAALLGGLLFVFDSGQVVAAKVRLLGAADAAAYSAAVWQARSLNFQSYMNRAMVANEIAIAQLVSLQSWSAYMGQVLQKTATVGSVVPTLAAPLQAMARGWNTVDQGLQRALPLLEAAASRWNADVLANAERVAAAQTVIAADDLAQRVAVSNVPAAQTGEGTRALRALNALRWAKQSTSYGRRGDERARLKQVVMDSRDGFSRARGWNLGIPLLALRKRGGTDLIGYDGWRAMDTLSLRVPALFGSPEQPLAWGANENRRAALASRGEHGGSYRDNPRTASRAVRDLRSTRGYSGLPAFRDLSTAALRANSELRYELELRQLGATIQTSSVALAGPATVVPGEQEKPFVPAYANDYAYALSAARVFFSRPEGRADGARELPSLFNPYWQARLAPITRQQRLVAAAAGRGDVDPYTVLP